MVDEEMSNEVSGIVNANISMLIEWCIGIGIELVLIMVFATLLNDRVNIASFFFINTPLQQ